MASEYNSLGPATNRLNFPDSPAEPLSLTCKELETLFAPLFDDSFTSRPPDVSSISAAQPNNIQEPDTPGQRTTTVATNGPLTESLSTADQTTSNSQHLAEDSG